MLRLWSDGRGGSCGRIFQKSVDTSADWTPIALNLGVFPIHSLLTLPTSTPSDLVGAVQMSWRNLQ